MNRKSLLRRLFHLLLLILLAVVPVAFGQPVSDKTLYIFLRVTGQAVHVDHAVLKPTPFRQIEREGSYRYTLLSQDNQALYTGYFHDPLVRFEDDFSDPHNPKGGKVRLEENEIHLTIPYLPTAQRIRFERLGEQPDQWVSLGVSSLSKIKE